MRRVALLGVLTLLAGCGDSSFGDFLGNTTTMKANLNAPVGGSENMLRARAVTVDVPPLAAEPGDVWPGPLPAPKTLSDIARSAELPLGSPLAPSSVAPMPAAPMPVAPRGSSTPPGAVAPMSAPVPAAVAPRPATAAAPVAPPAVIQTQSGAMVRNGGAPNLPNYTGPGGSGVLVDNGNGTSTLIAPDGRITTVPTPKQ